MTKKSKTTTSSPFDDYYYYDDDDFVCCWLDGETVRAGLKYTNRANQVASAIGLILNFFHLIVLTRKELRSNVVYFIMTSICICDILVFISNISEYITGKSYEDASSCGSYNQWLMTTIEIYSQGIQMFGRQCSALLALCMALLRALSVMFPMSEMMSRLMNFKSGILIVTFPVLIFGSYYGPYYVSMFAGQYPGIKCYYIYGTHSDIIGARTLVEAFFTFFVTLLYMLVTITLLIELCRAKKRRKALKTNKPDSTLLLIFSMSVSHFISQLFYSLVFIGYNYDSYNMSAMRLNISEILEHVPKILLTLNSITHCFICFLMSSQYKNVVLSLLRWKKTESTISVISPISTNSGVQKESSPSLKKSS